MGDNVGDVDAGLSNDCGLIAFSEDLAKHPKLKDAGATHIIANHADTLPMIERAVGADLI